MEQLCFFFHKDSNVECLDMSTGRINPDSVGIYTQTIKKTNVADDGNDVSFSSPQTSSFTPQSRTNSPLKTSLLHNVHKP